MREKETPLSLKEKWQTDRPVLREILLLAGQRYESHALFEEALKLSPKTVNNWKAGRSSSYLKMLPAIASLLSVEPSLLLEARMPREGGSLREAEFLALLRECRVIPEDIRERLFENVRSMIRLTVDQYTENRDKTSRKETD